MSGLERTRARKAALAQKAVLLAFAGVKLIASETPIGKLPIPLTLGVIVVAIGTSIVWSLLATRDVGTADDAQPADTGSEEHRNQIVRQS
ncbi:hypothetical protein [Nonomuraea dietziae]|uniref:hypothetical protein n=1 Tax=Nonomuraea dietziae TaxID=65515 RepID=UPI0033DE51C8